MTDRPAVAGRDGPEEVPPRLLVLGRSQAEALIDMDAPIYALTPAMADLSVSRASAPGINASR